MHLNLENLRVLVEVIELEMQGNGCRSALQWEALSEYVPKLSEGQNISSEQLPISAAYCSLKDGCLWSRILGRSLSMDFFLKIPQARARHQQHKTGVNKCSTGT